MSDREISFVRHGDQVVWITTDENGVTTTRTEYSPLQQKDTGNPFLQDVLQQLEEARPEPVGLLPPVFRTGPSPVATPVPPRTTVVKVSSASGTTTKTIQHGAPFTGGQFLLGLIVLVGVMGWALLLVRKATSR